MKKRALITTVVAVLLFFAAVAAGMNAVFTVTHVRAEFTTCSEEGNAEAHELREKLDKFIGRSTTFLELEDVRAVVEAYPCFRVVSIRKDYPTTVRLTVAERVETYAIQRGEEYEIIDAEGKFLYRRSENVNRASGENILLKGFSFPAGDGIRNGGYAGEMLAVMGAFREELTEIRSNVLSVELIRVTSDPRNDFFRICMKEGVAIDLGNPALLPAEKAKLAISRYLGLGDEARIFGFITVVDGMDDMPVDDYSRDSRLG